MLLLARRRTLVPMNVTSRSLGTGLARGLAAIALAMTLAACSGVDVGALVRQVAAPTSSDATRATTDGTAQAAVKQVIDSSNQAQATAFNTGDSSVMRQYASDSFYQQLVQTNRDLST